MSSGTLSDNHQLLLPFQMPSPIGMLQKWTIPGTTASSQAEPIIRTLSFPREANVSSSLRRSSRPDECSGLTSHDSRTTVTVTVILALPVVPYQYRISRVDPRKD